MRTCFSCLSAVATIRGRCTPCHDRHHNSPAQRAHRARRARMADGNGAAARLRKQIRGTIVECAVCKGQFRASLVDIDHRIPLFKGGKDEDENLQILCRQSCHRAKTAQDMGCAPF